MKETFAVVVETGNYFEDSGLPEVRFSCGHNHKTIEAARKCRDKLTRMYCQHDVPAGNPCSLCSGGRALPQYTSSTWYRARIHNNRGERVE